MTWPIPIWWSIIMFPIPANQRGKNPMSSPFWSRLFPGMDHSDPIIFYGFSSATFDELPGLTKIMGKSSEKTTGIGESSKICPYVYTIFDTPMARPGTLWPKPWWVAVPITPPLAAEQHLWDHAWVPSRTESLMGWYGGKTDWVLEYNLIFYEKNGMYKKLTSINIWYFRSSCQLPVEVWFLSIPASCKN